MVYTEFEHLPLPPLPRPPTIYYSVAFPQVRKVLISFRTDSSVYFTFGTFPLTGDTEIQPPSYLFFHRPFQNGYVLPKLLTSEPTPI